MHGYSIDSDERQRVPLLLAIAAIVLSYAGWVGLRELGVELPWWLSAPSLFGIYALISAAFDRWLWRMMIVRTVLRLNTPEVAGAWEGTVTPAADIFAKQPVTVTIRQTWSKIFIGLESADSHSSSTMAGISTQSLGVPQIIYEYQNEPRPSAVDGMHAHRGLARLTLQPGFNELDGEYFTGRDRVSHGAIRLNRVVEPLI